MGSLFSYSSLFPVAPLRKDQWTKLTSPSISHQMKLLIINERSSCGVKAVHCRNEKEYIYRWSHLRCIRNVGFWEIKENIIITSYQTQCFPSQTYVIPSLLIPSVRFYCFAFSVTWIKPSIFSFQYAFPAFKSDRRQKERERKAREREKASECITLIRASPLSAMRKHALESYINEVYFWQQNEESYLRLDMLNALSFMYQPKGHIFGWILKEIRCSGSQPKAGVATAGFVCKRNHKKMSSSDTVPSPSSILLMRELCPKINDRHLSSRIQHRG